jgi:hypothetical protein
MAGEFCNEAFGSVRTAFCSLPPWFDSALRRSTNERFPLEVLSILLPVPECFATTAVGLLGNARHRLPAPTRDIQRKILVL